MSFEVGQFLGSLFRADEPVAAVDLPQPDSVAAEAAGAEAMGVTAVSCLEYYSNIATDDDLHVAAAVFDEDVDTDDLWPDDNAVDLPPCESCEGLELWETMVGEWKCSQCNPPETAQRLLDKAERLRKRYGLPDPLGAV